MSLTPAYDERKIRERIEKIELCGKNRGPHDYVPIEWTQTDNVNRITRFMCRICFTNVATKLLLANYPEAL